MKNPKMLRALLLLALSLCLVTGSNAQTLWTTLSEGGADNMGTIAHFDPATSVWTTDYQFSTPTPGANPDYNSLTLANGKLYGVTNKGGAHNGGVIFELDPATGVYTRKFDFSAEQGSYPVGTLVYHEGKFYGMTRDGGIYLRGIIFEWDPVSNIFSRKIDFGLIGAIPTGSLTFAAGKFYGMTTRGGIYNQGIIFEWDPVTNDLLNRKSMECTSGCNGQGALTYTGSLFYGMARGGANDGGVIFKFDPATSAYTKVLDFDYSNGGHATGSLTLVDGILYGMTPVGGAANQGVIFELDPATDVFTKKKDFSCATACSPYGDLTYVDGKFYGLTQSGALFEWNRVTNTTQVKHTFSNIDGSGPHGSLTLAGGKLYGMTWGGGAANAGVIFSWDIALNSFSLLVEFNKSTSGSIPLGPLTYMDGKFYGMTSAGGLYAAGVLFEWNPVTHTYTKKLDLNATTGMHPQGGLTLLGNKLYGMMRDGGANGVGVIFEWSPQTDTYIKKIELNCTTGCTPYGSLTYWNGKFYGMTERGGSYRSQAISGVIFSWNPLSNEYVHEVDMKKATGGLPIGSLTYHNGKFYGMTASGGGGLGSPGTIFEWDPVMNNYLTKVELYSALGIHPEGDLTFVGDMAYGLTHNGGPHGAGVLFQWDYTTNEYSIKVNFDTNNGNGPMGSLTYSAGKLYGMTRDGGSVFGGTLFSFDPDTEAFIKKRDLNSATGTHPVYSRFTEVSAIPQQTINFSPIAEKNYTFPAFLLDGTASSGLPVTYQSSNTAVATISGNTVTIVGVGETIITASQAGNETYGPAPSVQQTLIVKKAPLTITAENKTKAAGQVNPPLTVTYSGFKPNEGPGVIDDLPALTTSSTTTSEPGIYHITLTGGADDHYDLILVNGLLTVTGAVPNVYVTSPTDGSTGQKVRLNIISKSVPGASLYTIKISPQIDFSSDVIMKSGGTSQPFDSLAYNTTYYARVKTDVASGFGKITSFTTVGPEYYSYVATPSNNAVNVKLSVIVSSYVVPGASTYTIELNTDPSFSPATAMVMTGGKSLNFSPLKPSTVYYNRVKTDLSDTWGQTRSFTTMAAPLPFVVSPANNSLSNNLSLFIVSSEIPGASSYTIQISEASDFSVISAEGKDASRSIAFFGLKYNTLYYTRAKTNLAPQYGEVRSFTTKDGYQDLYITTPRNGATNVNFGLNITSREIQGATLYTIEASTSSDFSGTTILNTSDSPLIWFQLAYDQLYYVRVKTDLNALWSPVQTFTTGNPSSLSFMTTPGNGSEGSLTTLAIEANLLSTATYYTIELNTSPDFAGTSQVMTRPYRGMTFSGLSWGTVYYTRVYTDLLPGVWGPTRSFKTALSDPYSHARFASSADEQQEVIVEKFSVRTYPNPFREKMTVYVETPSQQQVMLGMTDMTGKVIHQQEASSNTLIEVNEPIANGVYFLRVRTGGKSKVVRVVRVD